MYKRVTIKGLSLEDFKSIFDVRKKGRESEKDAVFRTARMNKGKKVAFTRDRGTGKINKLPITK